MARPARDLNFTPEEASSVNLMALHEATRWRRRWRGGAVEDLTWRGSPRHCASPWRALFFDYSSILRVPNPDIIGKKIRAI
jgi:hypothetical protein